MYLYYFFWDARRMLKKKTEFPFRILKFRLTAWYLELPIWTGTPMTASVFSCTWVEVVCRKRALSIQFQLATSIRMEHSVPKERKTACSIRLKSMWTLWLIIRSRMFQATSSGWISLTSSIPLPLTCFVATIWRIFLLLLHHWRLTSLIVSANWVSRSVYRKVCRSRIWVICRYLYEMFPLRRLSTCQLEGSIRKPPQLLPWLHGLQTRRGRQLYIRVRHETIRCLSYCLPGIMISSFLRTRRIGSLVRSISTPSLWTGAPTVPPWMRRFPHGKTERQTVFRTNPAQTFLFHGTDPLQTVIGIKQQTRYSLSLVAANSRDLQTWWTRA